MFVAVREDVVAAEIVTDVLPFHVERTYAPDTMPLPVTIAPVLMPVASATTSVIAPEAAVAVVANFSTELALASSVVARDHVVGSAVQ